MSKRPTLFWFGDGAVSTGFGVVAHNILNMLHKQDKYEIVQLGINYRGDPHEEPWIIYPTRTSSRADLLGQTRFLPLVMRHKPDVVIVNNDLGAQTWIPEQLMRARQGLKRPIPWISYFPIDGAPLPTQWVQVVDYMDVPVVYSKWGLEKLREANPKLVAEQIYHGVDPAKFYPLSMEERMKNKAMYVDNKFVVGFVGRNQPRKQIPRLVEAFSRFAKNKSDVMLYLHTSIRDQGWDIDVLVDRYKLHDKVAVADLPSVAMGVPSAMLNIAYNFMDVFILPTVGEGFGLPIVEAMAAKTPVAVTNCSVVPEIIQDNGILLDVETTYCMPYDGEVQRPLVSIEHMVEVMEDIYNNPERGEELGEKGYEHVLNNLTWEHTLPDWVRVIDSVLPLAKTDSLELDLEDM